jgi:hypothetical protein
MVFPGPRTYRWFAFEADGTAAVGEIDDLPGAWYGKWELIQERDGTVAVIVRYPPGKPEYYRPDYYIVESIEEGKSLVLLVNHRQFRYELDAVPPQGSERSGT